MASANSVNEAGSIHTIQGYDLNFAGVIIGRDVRFDPETQRVIFDRSNYHDAKGKENNKTLGIDFSDAEIFTYVRNIYSVLLSRGIYGTYVYVADPALREHLQQHFLDVR